jgi:hypothetical protein
LAPEIKPSSSPQKPSSLWGLLGILISAVAVWVFSKLDTPVEQSSDTTCSDDSTNNSTNDSRNYSARRVSVAKTAGPPSPTECHYAEKKHKRWWKGGNLMCLF